MFYECMGNNPTNTSSELNKICGLFKQLKQNNGETNYLLH